MSEEVIIASMKFVKELKPVKIMGREYFPWICTQRKARIPRKLKKRFKGMGIHYEVLLMQPKNKVKIIFHP